MKQKARLNPKVDVKGASSKAFLLLCKDAQITFITPLTITEDRMTYQYSLSQSWDETKNEGLNSEIRNLFPVVPEGLSAAVNNISSGFSWGNRSRSNANFR